MGSHTGFQPIDKLGVARIICAPVQPGCQSWEHRRAREGGPLSAVRLSIAVRLEPSPDAILAVEDFQLFKHQSLETTALRKRIRKLRPASCNRGNSHSAQFFRAK